MISIERILAIHQHNLAERGYTVKLSRIDNDPAGPVNGFRFMAAAKLYERALTIQIFDRSTVTIGWGFSNDEHVTLTKEDGKLFLEWLRREATTGKSPLTDAIWEVIPPAIPEKFTEPGSLSSAATNMAKARLVQYLVEHHADIFGKYGAIDQTPAERPGEDFYTELQGLIEDPERDGRDARRVIQILDNMAANLYTAANDALRVSGTGGSSDGRWHALGAVLAAEELRDVALAWRRNTADRLQQPAPTEPTFTHAITSKDLYEEILSGGRKHAPARVPLTALRELKPGDLVVIEPGERPRAGQIATVIGVNVGTDERMRDTVTVEFKGQGLEVTYAANEVRPLGPSPTWPAKIHPLQK